MIIFQMPKSVVKNSAYKVTGTWRFISSWEVLTCPTVLQDIPKQLRLAYWICNIFFVW